MIPPQRRFDGPGLMAVRQMDAAGPHGQRQTGIQRLGPGRIAGGPGGDALPGRNAAQEVGVQLQPGEQGGEGHGQAIRFFP